MMAPFPVQVMKLWNGWEVRVMVSLSLFFQIILIILGSHRKYSRSIWINLVVWLAYLSADWVAIVALGNLARSQGEDNSSQSSNNVLQAFWVPFLLLHLGGPDTITSYSLEDNELWLRHFLRLVVQVGVAFYVFVQYIWSSNNVLTFLAIPMFITGVIKYGERTLVLRSSSAKQLEDSLRSSPDSTGQDFDEIVSALEEGCPVELRPEESATVADTSNDKFINQKDNYLIQADFLFDRFRYLFADFILSHHERKTSYSIIHNKSAKEAFKLEAIELGFMYDVLYTKASTIYSKFGIFLRCFCFFSHVSVSFVFFILIDKHAYSPIDISISCVLLFGAIFLDVYAFIMLLLSDWIKLWLTKRNLISCDTCSYGLVSNSSRRWSESMGEYNLLSFCLADISSKTTGVQKLFGIKELLEKYKYLTWEDVNVDLQEMIFKKILKNGKEIEGDRFDIKLCKDLLARRGDYVLKKMLPPSYFLKFDKSHQKKFPNDQLWCSAKDVEFDHSIFLWHIATDLCYHVDFGNSGSTNA